MRTVPSSSFALMAEHSELHLAGYTIRSVHLKPPSSSGQVRVRLVWRHPRSGSGGLAAVVRQAGMTEGAAQALLAYLVAPGMAAQGFLTGSLAPYPSGGAGA